MIESDINVRSNTEMANRQIGIIEADRNRQKQIEMIESDINVRSRQKHIKMLDADRHT